MVPLEELEDYPRRSRWRRLVLIVVPAAAFVGLLAYGLLTSASQLGPGDPLPDFDLPRLDGGRLSNSDLAGRPVVINFFASWCLPCRDEAPILEEVAREYEDDGVMFVGVNVRDARSKAMLFVDEFDIGYPVVRDERLSLANDLGVYGLPETFFVDHEGELVGTVTGAEIGERAGTVILGAIEREQLVSNIEVLLRRAAGADGSGN